PGRGDEALSRQIVDLVRLRVAYHGREGGLVQQVRGHDEHAVEQVSDALVGIVRGTAHHAHDLVALRQQQLGEIRAVLSRDPGDQRGAPGLLRRGGRRSFRPLFPAPTGGVMLRDGHSSVGRLLWLESVRSVARAPWWGTTSATRTIRRTGAGIPTSSACAPW